MNRPEVPSQTSLENIHVREMTPLAAPDVLHREVALSEAARATVLERREEIKRILLGQDDRLMVIVGPCSIHDPRAAMDYARRLAALQEQVQDRLLVVMRVYFEKPRTTTGWKGLISDPHLDDSFEVEEGLRLARRLLVDINALGLAAATEFLDPIVPQYLADLVSWAAIGARTTESQTHRQMASGLSMPVGFKNSTDGSIQNAINAMLAARIPHSFLGIGNDGRCAVIRTLGNRWSHVILRGGAGQTNYDARHVADAASALEKAGLPGQLMVDCSHANSNKKHEQQVVVWEDLIGQRVQGGRAIIGAMIESNLGAGRQEPGKNMAYGVSITDACIDWPTTEKALTEGAQRLRKS